MKVALSTPGRFHTFDLARQLLERNLLSEVFTAFPRMKVAHEGVPPSLLHCLPWLQGPLMAYRKLGVTWPSLEQEWEWQVKTRFDASVARKLRHCDALVALSSVGLASSATAKRYGAVYVCDRGSCHIRFQDLLLREERERHEISTAGTVDPRIIRREEAEYQAADLITVPSTFAYESFLREGVPEAKLRMVPYGVELGRFKQVGQPDPETFQVLFVGGVTLQKGIPYLLDAFAKLTHPRKKLVLAGACLDQMRRFIRGRLPSEEVIILGPVKQTGIPELMSTSHVMVLSSVQDGFGMVLGQALACGCPVIATTHTGGPDLYTDGCEGYIVPIRDSEAIAERLEYLAAHPEVRERMSQAGLSRVRSLGGWNEYGASYAAALEGARSSSSTARAKGSL